MKNPLSAIFLMATVASLQAAPAFPLKVSENRRHLVDQRGAPFLYHADTPWMIFLKLTEAESKEYIARRKEQGFNALQVQLTGFLGVTNREGELPFAGTPPEQDFAKPNEKFFRHVDRVVREAQRQGMLLAIAPAWSDCYGVGWAGKGKDGHLKPLNVNGAEKSRALGRWLGKRYGKFENVLWILGGDNEAWWCVLGGGFGHAYGTPNWNFPANWREVLELPGANSLKHLRTLLESRAGWKLVPDVHNVVAVEGRGAFATNDYAVTTLADDGSFALSDLPSKRALTIDLTKVSGARVVASWFNPRTGETTRIGEFADQKRHPFEPPGDGDWVLTLDDAARKPPEPGINVHKP